MRLIDLSVPINEDTPIYPGDPKTEIKPNGVMDTDGYEDHFVCVGTHVGTHVDAPRHMIKDGKSLDQITPDNFAGRGIVIDVRNGFSLEKVKAADIKEGDIVLFYTGMSHRYHQSAYYDAYPAITEEIAGYLVEKKIKMVGVDMCSVDHEPFKVHKIFLKEQILIIENLTNLEALIGREFKIYAFPIKLQIDGAPARVIAEILG
ncbi:MAG: cyclase family protein [Candidatus Curtissbacteria bacterium]|nr:cyclase family protein [Candidatus Curtissbacteria bacterium]